MNPHERILDAVRLFEQATAAAFENYISNPNRAALDARLHDNRQALLSVLANVFEEALHATS